MINPPRAESVSFAAADARRNGALSARFNGDYDTVSFFDGDIELDGDFLKAINRIDPQRHRDRLILVTGDLTVRGPISLLGVWPGLYVGGYTRAETLEGHDAEIHVHDGTFTHLVHGNDPGGTLSAGLVHAPWVIDDNHDLRITAPDALFVDNGGSDHLPDFDDENIARSFVQEVVETDDRDDPEDPATYGYASIDVPAFLARLRAGEPVLRPGARTHTQLVDDDLARAVAGQVAELDLSGRKLRSLPPNVLRMPWLRRLVVQGTDIAALPTEIGRFARLEELDLEGRWRDAPEGQGPGFRLPDLGGCRALRRLGLVGLGLTALPEGCYALPALERIDLRRNRLDDETRRRLVAAYPDARVDLDDPR